MDSSTPSDISYYLHSRPILLREGQVSSKRDEIKEYFNKTYTLYEKLFEVITESEAFYLRPEPLRHPLIFYYGHTASFFVNKFMVAGIIKSRINPLFETMFAVGVDEMSWDDLLPEHYNWPKLEELKAYRNQVRQMVNEVIDRTPLEIPITWESPFWVIIMGIEHERIHLETSSVIIRRLAVEFVKPTPFFQRCTLSNHQGYLQGSQPNFSKLPENVLLPVEKATVQLCKDDKLYGWDNEYGVFSEEVASFSASKYLVSNGEFLEFVKQGGYNNESYWTEEGKSWLKSTKTQYPLFWVSSSQQTNQDSHFKYRTMTEIIDMPWDWPVETNYLEAKAFCNWKAKTTGKKIRLPTEAEYLALRELIKEDIMSPGFENKGNIGLFHWASSCPVDLFETKGFYDILGNVWQHCESTINGFKGFKVHKYYDDFSTPTFDGKHNMIKGGSWISTGNEAMKNSRYAFRRHFFQHAGFRYVEAEDLKESQENFMYQIDETEAQMLEFNYGEEVFAVKNWGQRCAELCKQVFAVNSGEQAKSRRVLDIGCTVGRTSFELAKYFDEVVGLDFSARFFHLAVSLKEKGCLNYFRKTEGELNEFINLELNRFDFYPHKEKVAFFQQPDVCNIDLLKYNGFDLVFAGNLLEKLHESRSFLKKIHLVLADKGIFVLSSTYDWKNEVSNAKNWVGGVKYNAENKTSYEGIKEILRENFEEIEKPVDQQLIIRESCRKFQHYIANFTFWRKK